MNDLKDYIESGDLNKLTQCESIDDRVQKSKPSCAIFYYLHESENAEAKLINYLSEYTPDILVLNRSFPVNVPSLVVKKDKWNEFQQIVCDKYFPLPQKPKILAITGTNGKTTTADLVLQLATMSSLRAISIGTLGVRGESGQIEDFGLTTPSFIQLRRILFQYASDCDVVAIEVSSHALDQKRAMGLEFYSAGWTSFTQDHLDYHETMENYFKAKEKIVDHLRADGKLYFPSSQEHISKKIHKQSICVVLGSLDEELRMMLPAFFKTKFNLDNLSVAMAMINEITQGHKNLVIKDLKPTPGRFYLKEWKGRAAIVDFAHTPDALENLLGAVKDLYPDFWLKVLFGCGGDRDRSKRSLMGLAVEKFADEIIITSDNPRTEDPMQIIEDVARPLKNALIKKIEDRPSALLNELSNLKVQEVLVIAGKGHEDYIIKGTQKFPYSDISTLDNYLRGLSND